MRNNVYKHIFTYTHTRTHSKYIKLMFSIIKAFNFIMFQIYKQKKH